MNRFAFVSFWRSLTRHKLYAALNIGGLALGIAVFLMLALYVRFQTSFEQWLPDADQIYVVVPHQATDAPDRPRTSSPEALLRAIDEDIPGTVGTRLHDVDVAVVKNGTGVSEALAFVDPDFFDVFRFKALDGALPASFKDPSAIVITRRTAQKYFGSASPIGRLLPITYGTKRMTYHVVATIDDLPANTELKFDLIAPLVISDDRSNPEYVPTHQWNYNDVSTYVRLHDAAAAQRFSAALPGVALRHAAAETPDQTDFKVDLILKDFVGSHMRAAGATLMVSTLGIVGALTLSLAIINYINLATARGGLRAREVAMRKVLGASRAILFRHLIGEAIVTAAIAAIAGMALAELGMPLLNAVTGLDLSIHYFVGDGVILPLVGLTILVGAIAGFYPAMILSRIPAATVLAAARTPGGGRGGARVREALVVFQFAVTIALIVGTGILVAQTRHVRSADVGYDRAGLMVVKSFGNDSVDAAQRDSVLHRFAALPGVTSVGTADTAPGGGWFTSGSNFTVPGIAGPGPDVERYDTYPGFFTTVGAKLIAGRLFDASRGADFNPALLPAPGTGPLDPNADPRVLGSNQSNAMNANIVINRTAVKAFHFASPEQAIGKVVGASAGTPRTIIGVVDDLRVGSPRQSVAPTVYQFGPRPHSQTVAVIRFTGDPQAFAVAAAQAWREIAPQVPFTGKTASQALERYYQADDRMADLFGIGAALAVGIGCIGLWGLAAFTTSRRIKEIGIRKTLGASSGDVVRLLVGQFLRPVLIANLFAWPLAFVAMRTWLAGFDDRIALSPLFFVAATILALVIAVATVLTQSLRASRATPAWALRHE